MKRIKSDHPDAKKYFLDALENKQLVAYPTDTIYGIGTTLTIQMGLTK